MTMTLNSHHPWTQDKLPLDPIPMVRHLQQMSQLPLNQGQLLLLSTFLSRPLPPLPKPSLLMAGQQKAARPSTTEAAIG